MVRYEFFSKINFSGKIEPNYLLFHAQIRCTIVLGDIRQQLAAKVQMLVWIRTDKDISDILASSFLILSSCSSFISR